MNKIMLLLIIIIMLAGCTLVSMTTQVTVGNDDRTEDTTENSENLDLSRKPLIGVNQ